MSKKLKITTFSILLLFMMLSNIALTPPAHVLLSPTDTLTSIKPSPSGTASPVGAATQLTQAVTATPGKTPNGRDARPTPIPLAAQAGKSDWIVAIGILIVAIIVVPILVKHSEWRGN